MANSFGECFYSSIRMLARPSRLEKGRPRPKSLRTRSCQTWAGHRSHLDLDPEKRPSKVYFSKPWSSSRWSMVQFHSTRLKPCQTSPMS